MTEDEIVRAMLRAGVSVTRPIKMHPAWPHFVIAMRDKQYGPGPTLQAWSFFASGWDAEDIDPGPPLGEK